MKTLESIYNNRLGNSYKIISADNKKDLVALEMNQISFLINDEELKSFITSTQTIINHHSQCSCPPDLENKMVIYKSNQTEIRMLLSFNQLFLLKDLLKGTEFKLSMNQILENFKIN